MKRNKNQLQKFSNFVVFQTPTGKVNIDVYFKDETLWLTQKAMARLFEVNVPAVSKHLKNIFESRELEEKSVISKMETTANCQVMNMTDWDKYLQQFLELTDKPILKDKGKISMLEAKLKAESEYDKFRVKQDREYISDFDREVQKFLKDTNQS